MPEAGLMEYMKKDPVVVMKPKEQNMKKDPAVVMNRLVVMTARARLEAERPEEHEKSSALQGLQLSVFMNGTIISTTQPFIHIHAAYMPSWRWIPFVRSSLTTIQHDYQVDQVNHEAL